MEKAPLLPLPAGADKSRNIHKLSLALVGRRKLHRAKLARGAAT